MNYWRDSSSSDLGQRRLSQQRWDDVACRFPYRWLSKQQVAILAI